MKRRDFLESELPAQRAKRQRLEGLLTRIRREPVIESAVWQAHLEQRWGIGDQAPWRWEALDVDAGSLQYRGEVALASADRVYAAVFPRCAEVQLFPPGADPQSLPLPSDHFPHPELAPVVLGAALPLICAWTSYRDWYAVAEVCRAAAQLLHGAASPFHLLWSKVRHLLPPWRRAPLPKGEPIAKPARKPAPPPPWRQLRRLEAPRLYNVLVARPDLLRQMLPSICQLYKEKQQLRVQLEGGAWYGLTRLGLRSAEVYARSQGRESYLRDETYKSLEELAALAPPCLDALFRS